MKEKRKKEGKGRKRGGKRGERQEGRKYVWTKLKGEVEFKTRKW